MLYQEEKNLKQLLGSIPLAIALLLATVAGCRNVKDDPPPAQLRGNEGVREDLDGSRGADSMARVILSHEPQAFSFHADRARASTNLPTFIASLKAGGVREIILESKVKLTGEDRQYYLDAFRAAGLNVNEFWVPIALPPGRWNVMAK